MSAVSANIAIGVGQRQWGITNSAGKKPIIGTDGLGPCAMVIIDDRVHGISCGGHVDAITSFESIKSLFNQMLIKSAPSDLKVYLIGGWEDCTIANYDDPMQLPSILEKTFSCKVDTSRFCKKKSGWLLGEKLAAGGTLTSKEHAVFRKTIYKFIHIDSRTGEIFTVDDTNFHQHPSIAYEYPERSEAIPQVHELTETGFPLVKVWDVRAKDLFDELNITSIRQLEVTFFGQLQIALLKEADKKEAVG